MGYRFTDFLGDVVTPLQDVWLAPFRNILGTVSSLGSSLSMPLMIGGGVVLLIMLKK